MDSLTRGDRRYHMGVEACVGVLLSIYFAVTSGRAGCTRACLLSKQRMSTGETDGGLRGNFCHRGERQWCFIPRQYFRSGNKMHLRCALAGGVRPTDLHGFRLVRFRMDLGGTPLAARVVPHSWRGPRRPSAPGVAGKGVSACSYRVQAGSPRPQPAPSNRSTAGERVYPEYWRLLARLRRRVSETRFSFCDVDHATKRRSQVSA